MPVLTAAERRERDRERQRRSRARRALQAPPPQAQACHCCSRWWVPQRQGRYCSRPCIEKAGRLRRALAGDHQQQALASWLSRGDAVMRQRLLEAHRHLLQPETEEALIAGGWLMGPPPGRVEHSAMAVAAITARG